MSVYIRTSKNSGISVPFIAAPFIALVVGFFYFAYLLGLGLVVGGKITVALIAAGYQALRTRHQKKKAEKAATTDREKADA